MSALEIAGLTAGYGELPVIEWPAIAEDETSTLVTAAFTATTNALGYILMQRRKESLR